MYIRPSSETSDVELQHIVFCSEFLDALWSWEPLRRSCVRWGWCRATSAPYTWPTQRLRMLHFNVWCSWWWAYVLETCRAKITLIKITLLHQVGISNYFLRKMHGQTTLKLSTASHKGCMCAYGTVSDELYVCVLNCVKKLLSYLLNFSVRQTRKFGVTTGPNGYSNNQTSL